MTPGGDDLSRLEAGQARLATAVVVERLRAGRPTSLRIRGRSMYPFLTVGQYVLLQPCTARSLHRGDLVAFARGGRIILHRVLSVSPTSGQVTEKGDNVRQATVIEENQVLGWATAIQSRRRVLLTRSRYVLTSRWLARLSAVHASLHRWAGQHRLSGKPLAAGFTLLFRLAVFLFRPTP